MKFENGFCTFEQSKQFKEYIGYRNSLLCWWQDCFTKKYELRWRNDVQGLIYPAYSCAELWKMFCSTFPTWQMTEKLMRDMVDNADIAAQIIANEIIDQLKHGLIEPGDLNI